MPLEGSGRDLLVIIGFFPQGLERTAKKTIGIACIPAQILTEYLQNMSP
jgi:hypothetical protein